MACHVPASAIAAEAGEKRAGRKRKVHTLHLLRHAKSSWKGDLDDFDRPLNRRGREAARLVGKNFAKTAAGLGLVLCSSAVRARETCDIVFSGVTRRPRCLIERELYVATAEQLVARLQRLDEAEDAVLLIGHNPGLHELALALGDPKAPQIQALAAGKFPTGARIAFAVATSWARIGEGRHAVIDYVAPASLGGKV
jgi:phosphohistidine phosphatase